MRYFKYTVFILLLATGLYTQNISKRTGIAAFYDSATKNTIGDKSKIVLSELSNSLSKYRFIKLVDRSIMDEVIKEIEISQTGLIDESTALEAGKIHGLQMMITGSIHKNRITARAICMETQKVITSATGNGISSINHLGDKLATGIEVFLARENLKNLRNDSRRIDLSFSMEASHNMRKRIMKSTGRVRIGDKVKFKFRCNRDGHITIVDIQPSGDVVILFPNDLHPDNRIISEKEYSVPSPDDGFEITVSEPTGLDTIVLFFTEKKVEWLDRKKLAGEGFWSVKKGMKLDLTRGFKINSLKLKQTEWETKELRIDVQK